MLSDNPDPSIPPAGNSIEKSGGDPACWLANVCPDCGSYVDDPSLGVCPRCGGALPPEE